MPNAGAVTSKCVIAMIASTDATGFPSGIWATRRCGAPRQMTSLPTSHARMSPGTWPLIGWRLSTRVFIQSTVRAAIFRTFAGSWTTIHCTGCPFPPDGAYRTTSRTARIVSRGTGSSV